ncbi:uncharacterized protein LOC109004849 [Juglans regia]|uniref:Uncharacterized protein LOC109004849 n=1 Tax=Juglans regia TaxID=51240 RepID=A0A6P9ECH9_JUGRE|nr:uncharacterized protein LOC109004849 [Juglans regia]
MWLKSEGFVERVKQWWISYRFEGTSSFIFANKLKALKRDLKECNKQSFGNIEDNKNAKWMEIQVLERLQEGRPLNVEEQAQKTLLVADLERIILQEELSWRQKSRALWLKEGDRSTREEEAIKVHVVDFFEKLLTEQVGWRPTVDGLVFNLIEPGDGARMERTFEEGEVFDVVRKMFEKSLNSTFIALIPKKAGAIEITDFRPISLVNGVYKIILKVLANRLSEVLGKIVTKPQIAFVKGAVLGKGGGLGLVGVYLRIIAALLDNGFVSGFQIGSPSRGFISISHMLFADDTLIMCEANRDQLGAVKACLLCFEAVSGLKVNYDKSELVPIGEVHNIRELADTLGCKIASLPMTYLGLPLGIASRACSIWNTGRVGALEKLEGHMVWSYGSILEKGGRSFNNILGSSWVQAQGLDFGRMFGVATVLSKTCFLYFS